MAKIDLKKELKLLYSQAVNEVKIINVPTMNYLMVDGKGDPNTSQEYKNAIETLYPLAYTLKFIIKKEKEVDYTVMPLEGLWWVDDMTQFSMENKDMWQWTAMIMQPEFITKNMFIKALEQVQKKNLPSLSKIRFEDLHEGLSAQIIHIGPYSAEKPAIEKLHNFIIENGYKMYGKHHEIYLSDPRKSAPEKMKTIIRQPIRK